MGVKGYEKGQPLEEARVRLNVEIEVKTAPEVKPEAKTEVKINNDPKLAPRTFALPKVGEKERPVEAAYSEHLERLEELIEEQVAEVVAEVAEIAEAQGLEPSDITLLWSLDITGKDAVKCVFCGRPTCGFRPQVYRVKNPEVDLLGDSIIVLQEIASRAGIKYGVVVYDDQDVLVLREPGVAEDEKERASTYTRYAAFRDRIEYPDPNSQAWMQERLKKWTPDQAVGRKAGDPLDAKMFDVSFKVFEQTGGALKSMTLVKSMAPRIGMRGIEARGTQQGVGMCGMAVGAQAEYIAPRMLANTIVAPDLHQLREKVSEGVKASLERIKEMKA